MLLVHRVAAHIVRRQNHNKNIKHSARTSLNFLFSAADPPKDAIPPGLRAAPAAWAAALTLIVNVKEIMDNGKVTEY